MNKSFFFFFFEVFRISGFVSRICLIGKSHNAHTIFHALRLVSCLYSDGIQGIGWENRTESEEKRFFPFSHFLFNRKFGKYFVFSFLFCPFLKCFGNSVAQSYLIMAVILSPFISFYLFFSPLSVYLCCHEGCESRNLVNCSISITTVG